MSAGLSGLKVRWQGKLLDDALRFAKDEHYSDTAGKFDQSGLQPEQVKHASDLAFAFYRRALVFRSHQDESRAVRDLRVALRFPELPRQFRRLAQQRLAVIQNGAGPEVEQFDAMIAERFEKPPSEVVLRDELLRRFGLKQAMRNPTVREIDEVSAIGVYRWAGDRNSNERWSRLIREFKQGDPTLPGFFGRILAEHMRTTPMCRAWLREVDYIVPVPAAESRRAERGFDILTKTGEHLSSRLGIPLRTDFLNRADNSVRSRFAGKTELARQYSFEDRKTAEIQERIVLLLDDVMNRGHTTEICALRLREAGCRRVLLLVLAQAESSLQSSRRHAQVTGE